MSKIKKVAKGEILATSADSSVKIKKDIAAISLNKDGNVNICISQEQFTNLIHDAFDPEETTSFCIIKVDCDKFGCGQDNKIGLGLNDIKILMEKGILLQNRLTPQQIKAIKAVRD